MPPSVRDALAQKNEPRMSRGHDQATIDEAAFVTAALVALGGAGHDAAYTALVDVAEKASRQRVSPA